MSKSLRSSKPTLRVTKWNFNDTCILTICLVASFLICWYFHDKGWLRRDAGYFGYVSQRILEGDVLHRDIQVLHAGLINFINALFLKLTDGDLIGPRYPLIALTIIQSGLGYKLALKNGRVAAVTAVLVLTAFGFLQFINPTPNWYAMCLAVVLMYFLDTENHVSARKIFLIGLIVGIIFLLRQLSGLFMAIAVTVIILLKNPSLDSGSRPIAGKVLVCALALGLAIFLYKTGHWMGLVFIGTGPIILLVLLAYRTRNNVKDTSKIVAYLSLGSFFSACPLLFYHLVQGTFYYWIQDSILANISLANMQMFDIYNYIDIPAFAIISVVLGDVFALGGFVYWTALLIVPLVLVISLIQTLKGTPNIVPAVGIIACLYSLVSVIFETPIYLSYSTGLVLFALLCNEGTRHKRKLVVLCVFLSVIAITFQAAENKHTIKFTATNSRLLESTHNLPGHSIKVGLEDASKYQRLNQLINRCTLETDKIYAFPIHPEVYFLSKRESAFRFMNSGLGLHSKQDIEIYADSVLSSNDPALIFHNELDVNNNTIQGNNFLDRISHQYDYLGNIEEFTIYLRVEHPLQKSCQKFASGLR